MSNEGGSDAGNSTAGAAAGGSVAVLADPQEVARAAGNTLQASGIGEALLALLEDGENAQTPAEWASVAPVTSAAWSFPQIQRFPARITLKNNTPSRVVVLGVRLEPYTELSADLYEDSHARLEKYLTSHARLGGWDHSIGVQVTHDSED
ncbi:hypothetical protein [Pseudomonas sp. PNPG3]|uniref:hypothetical protein n=1 Tax=Pseudomonas sp. PNPG3 TaxID=2919497 RepID=UPI001FFDE2C2|nr:hypothetical protein [Pseudomonas sp. PNPG3]MCK2122128.1 hypothetical protein [Pseudomonas sp. PNPG3]